MSQKMKSLVKAKAEPGIWMEDVAVPKYGIDDVLIKIKKTAICGTDIHIYSWDEWAKSTISVPMTIGHEFYGEVVEVGSHVKNIKPGQRVSGEGHITCGVCRNCRAGKQHLCRNTLGLGVHRPGAFAEYLVMPASNVMVMPDNITGNQAAIMDPFGNAAHCALTFDMVGEDVLITGAGPTGVMAAAIARHVGARHVVITDVNDYRLKLAEKMGVSKALNVKYQSIEEVQEELGMLEGFDIGLEMSGNPMAFKDMLKNMNHGGRIAMLGIPPDETSINWNEVIFKLLTIKGIYGREMYETWYKMISMLQSGLEIDPVMTHHYPVDEYQNAFQIMASGQSGKVILEWD